MSSRLFFRYIMPIFVESVGTQDQRWGMAALSARAAFAQVVVLILYDWTNWDIRRLTVDGIITNIVVVIVTLGTDFAVISIYRDMIISGCMDIANVILTTTTTNITTIGIYRAFVITHRYPLQ